MNPAHYLTIAMLALSALQILMVLVFRSGQQGLWVIVNLAVLAAGAGMLAFLPAWAPVVVGAVFVPFVLMPALFGHFAQRRANMSRLDDAAWYAAWAARLHPSGPVAFLAKLYRALANSDPDACIAALESIGDHATPRQRNVIAILIAARRNDWERVCNLSGAARTDDRSVRSMAIRALGETGQTEAMVQAFQTYKTGFVGYDLFYAQLFVMAFTGRTQATNLILDSLLASLDDDAKSYWRAISRYYASDGPERDEELLSALAQYAEKPTTRSAAQRHLASRDAYSAWLGLSEASRRETHAIEHRIATEAPRAKFGMRSMVATLVLMALLTGMFFLEIWYGGSEDTEILVRLGGLWPPYVTQLGEWWRLVTAILLHAGWLHFLANVFVLFVLGRIVETTLGPLRVLIGFFVGGVFSSAMVLAAMEWGLTEQAILVGASGGVFALFGVEVATQIINWQRTRDALDRRRVILLGGVMLLQLAIDISMPEISLTAHLSGFAAGLLLGALFSINMRRATSTSHQ